MLPWYSMTCSQTFENINSRTEGLSEDEVENRIIHFGKNCISRKKRKSIIQILYTQVKSLMMVLLFCSVIISVAIGEYLDATILFLVIAVNVISGFFMEYKAEKAFEALEKMVVDQARVIRDGQDQLIDAKGIVPGDIVVFEEGDKLPADLRIFRAVDLRINESILTGESFPSNKHSEPICGKVSVADMENMAFSGTIVTSGSGKGIVVATGSQTEFGKISSLVQEGNEETPLQRRLNSLGKTLLILSATLSLIIFFSGLMRGEELIPLLVYIVSLTVSAVPEALPTVTTLALAIGAIEIAKKNAIIRRLPVLETLGSIDVICSDKTGTITKNEMTIRKILLFDRQLEISGIGYEPEGEFFENGKILNPLKDTDLY